MSHFLPVAGFHVCAAGWMAKGRVGYPIVKAGANCGFGKTGIVDYGIRLNRSERWDAYCYNPNGVFGNHPLLFGSMTARCAVWLRKGTPALHESASAP